MLEAADLSWVEIAALGFVVLAASYIRGLTGFGFSAVLVAGLAFFMDPARAVPLALGYEVIASAVQAPSVWEEIRWRTLSALVVAALVGNPVGLLILANAEPDLLRAVTYGVLLVLTLGLLRRGSGRIEATWAMFFAVGLIAGVVNGATALSGLVLVLAMSFMTVTPAELRATLIAYFFAADLFVVGVLVANDDVGSVDAWRIVVGLPLLIVGVAMGSRMFRGIAPEKFRRITVWLLVSLSAVGLLRVAIG